MSTIVTPEIAASATIVLEQVRKDYWRTGQRVVASGTVVEMIQKVLSGADSDESTLPDALRKLLKYARGDNDEIGLSALMTPLSQVAASS